MTAQGAVAEDENIIMKKNINASGIAEETPLAMMTIGQLLEVLSEHAKSVEADKHNYVYGLSGIQNLFGVSHKTAQIWKNTWLAPACMQSGRKIIVDADKAMELFKERRYDYE